jgi:phosphatidylglycerol:prolipoprotein diacylglycerol transferase
LITLDPVVLRLGPLAVRWFGLLALVGLGLAIWLSLRELDRQRLGRKLALDALAWGLPVGLVTARLVHVLAEWDYYFTRPSELWQLNVDGLSLWGGLFGGALVAAARLRAEPLKRWRILDAIAPYAALGIALGRDGEFLDGHGQGVPALLPWATQYASPLAASPDFGVSRHPAQLYDALLAVGLFALLRLLPSRLPPGTRVAAFLVLYGSGRVLLGAVRLDPVFLFGLQLEQLLAFGAVGWGMWFGGRLVVSHALRWARFRARVSHEAPAQEEGSVAA